MYMFRLTSKNLCMVKSKASTMVSVMQTTCKKLQISAASYDVHCEVSDFQSLPERKTPGSRLDVRS